MAKKENSSFEQKLFKAADKLRKNIDAAEYKHVVLGLVFLKYISESFTELYDKLEADEWSDPEDRDEYIAENVFFVPKLARWGHIHSQAKLPTIGQTIDEAMEAVEKENKELKNVLPQVFGKANLDKTWCDCCTLTLSSSFLMYLDQFEFSFEINDSILITSISNLSSPTYGVELVM
jgi:type I restriction enzyme M protein